MTDRVKVTPWRVVAGRPDGAQVLERGVSERLTIAPGCWYDIKSDKKWGKGNVAQVEVACSGSASCVVYKEDRRRQRNGRQLIGQFSIPYTAFLNSF